MGNEIMVFSYNAYYAMLFREFCGSIRIVKIGLHLLHAHELLLVQLLDHLHITRMHTCTKFFSFRYEFVNEGNAVLYLKNKLSL